MKAKSVQTKLEDIHIHVEATGALTYVGNTPHGRAIIAAAKNEHVSGNDTMQHFIENCNVSYRYMTTPAPVAVRPFVVPDILKAAGVPQNFIGARIKEIRLLNASELEAFGWTGQRAVVVGLDNGDFMIASSDPEGNSTGALFTKNTIIC